MQIALVVAVADNGVIGRDQQLPWHLPDDLRHFKAVTMGKPLLMGRRTLESIGRALPGRRNLVLTRGPAPAVPGTEAVSTLNAAIERCGTASELCVIGGAEVFALALPLATRIYETQVHATVAGDVFFPPLDMKLWQCVDRQEHAADSRHAYAMSFLTLERHALPAANTAG
ncbi:MAG TPA: dihydrofolate reductase [Steroidobacteraceae bacterium]